MLKSGQIEYTHKKMLRHLTLIAILMIIGMAFYEMVKQFVFPDITIWQSHFVTVAFSTFSATLVSFYILKKHIRLSTEATRNKNEAAELHMDLIKAHAVIEAIIESPENVVIFALDHKYRYLSFNKNLSGS